MYLTFAYASWLSTLLPVAFVKTIRNNAALSAVWLLCVLSFLADSASLVLLHKNTNNLQILNIYVLLEFVLVLAVFFFWWPQRRLRVLLLATGVGVISFLLVSGIFSVNSEGIVWLVNITTAVPITCASLLELTRLIRNETKRSIGIMYQFWITCAFLVYFFGNFSVFLFSELILHPLASPFSKNLWIVHNLIHIVFNVLLIKAFFVWKINSSSSTSVPASR